MTGRQLLDVVSRNAGPARSPRIAGGPFRRKYNKFHVAPKAERIWRGIQFASKGEMERHKQLVGFEQVGKISDLERQVPVVLAKSPEGKPLLRWIVDWRYVENGHVVVEDFTGVMTSLKRSNIRICAAMYPDVVIRISKSEGSTTKRTVVIDCVNGKVPAKKRKSIPKTS